MKTIENEDVDDDDDVGEYENDGDDDQLDVVQLYHIDMLAMNSYTRYLWFHFRLDAKLSHK